jgi:hypothetical protein
MEVFKIIRINAKVEWIGLSLRTIPTASTVHVLMVLGFRTRRVLLIPFAVSYTRRIMYTSLSLLPRTLI